MGLFSRGPEEVITQGRRVRGRIVAVDVCEKTRSETSYLHYEYVVGFGLVLGLVGAWLIKVGWRGKSVVETG